MIAITDDFDSGNIKVVDASDPSNIRLEIKPDGKANFFQWFYFRVDAAAGKHLTLFIDNAHASSYIGGWSHYRAVVSEDRETWRRVDTAFDGKRLKIVVQPKTDAIYVAYFAPYPTTRYFGFVERMKLAPILTHETLGKTLDGQDIDCFHAGTGPRALWVIARQHPGEAMGSWWMEGFLERLCDPDDLAARRLLAGATLHVVPCMNLDGVRRGHLRTNAAGRDLNRAWRNTTREESPEVYFVREHMRRTGVDFFLDVHGDEAIANNFLDSAFGVPSWDERQEGLFNRFSARLLAASKDFQDKEGYPPAAPGKANLDIANSYVAETWKCLSMTLEMPFKDAAVKPDPAEGWSPARCRAFARDILAVMADTVDELR